MYCVCVCMCVCSHKLVVLATDLLQQVLRCDGLEHILLAGLLQLAAQHQLVQDEVRLLKVEDYVQLAHLQIYVHQLTSNSIRKYTS